MRQDAGHDRLVGIELPHLQVRIRGIGSGPSPHRRADEDVERRRGVRWPHRGELVREPHVSELFQQVVAADLLEGERGREIREAVGELEAQRVVQDPDRTQEGGRPVRPRHPFESRSQPSEVGLAAEAERRRAEPSHDVRPAAGHGSTMIAAEGSKSLGRSGRMTTQSAPYNAG